jgi:hypothetical protein
MLPGVGAKVPGTEVRVPAAGAKRSCSALRAATWQERSSIPCRNAVLVSAGWEVRSAQWAAASELPSGWQTRMASMLGGSQLDHIV